MVRKRINPGKSTYIPYRDSLLTHILKYTIGGNSKTSLIINCSPARSNEEVKSI